MAFDEHGRDAGGSGLGGGTVGIRHRAAVEVLQMRQLGQDHTAVALQVTQAVVAEVQVA